MEKYLEKYPTKSVCKIPTDKTREPIINAYMVFHRCSVFLCRQQGVY